MKYYLLVIAIAFMAVMVARLVMPNRDIDN